MDKLIAKIEVYQLYSGKYIISDQSEKGKEEHVVDPEKDHDLTFKLYQVMRKYEGYKITTVEYIERAGESVLITLGRNAPVDSPKQEGDL